MFNIKYDLVWKLALVARNAKALIPLQYVAVQAALVRGIGSPTAVVIKGKLNWHCTLVIDPNNFSTKHSISKLMPKSYLQVD